MISKKPSLTIGIPAYNEEENIGLLLKDIARQKISKANLENIIIYSDGSSDATVEKCEMAKLSKVKVIDEKERRGKAFAINKIIQITETNILVILDADTRILDQSFIDKLISPIAINQADLTSAKVEELPAKNFVQKILAFSMKMKKEIFISYNRGNNLFTCHGRSRGFSKKMYKKFHLKISASEDANSYLTCLFNNMIYQYVSDASIYYQLPRNFSDHKKQSIRFLQYKDHFDKKFGEKLVKKEYSIPLHIWVRIVAKYLLIHPVYFACYILILMVLKVESLIHKENNQTWGISKSSKKVAVT